MTALANRSAMHHGHGRRVMSRPVFAAFAAALALAGCATNESIRRPTLAPWTAADPPGMEMLVPHGLRDVLDAAVEAVERVGLRRIEQDDVTLRYILAERGVTAWSWGEIVGIYLRPLDDRRTVVRVESRARLSTNITATDFTHSVMSAIWASAERRAAEQPQLTAPPAPGGQMVTLPPIIITPAP
ncbi:MAG: hypothetical protein WCJ30_00465 [Deltaproteobacteria bacterium]